jgi:hypothetical protein
MNDADLADEIIARLNKLIENDEVRKDISRLIETRVPCSKATLDHPTIQAGWPTKDQVGSPNVGFLGVVNGLLGILPDGPKKGWGYITAHFEDNPDGGLLLKHFIRTINA